MLTIESSPSFEHSKRSIFSFFLPGFENTCSFRILCSKVQTYIAFKGAKFDLQTCDFDIRFILNMGNSIPHCACSSIVFFRSFQNRMFPVAELENCMRKSAFVLRRKFPSLNNYFGFKVSTFKGE